VEILSDPFLIFNSLRRLSNLVLLIFSSEEAELGIAIDNKSRKRPDNLFIHHFNLLKILDIPVMQSSLFGHIDPLQG